jgi:transcriptional regulator with XRE-family HTH domain
MASQLEPAGPGDRLREERRRRQIRQRDLAAAMQYAAVTVSLVETNQVRPWPAFMQRAAEVLGMEVDDLFPAIPLPQGSVPEDNDGA